MERQNQVKSTDFEVDHKKSNRTQLQNEVEILEIMFDFLRGGQIREC